MERRLGAAGFIDGLGDASGGSSASGLLARLNTGAVQEAALSLLRRNTEGKRKYMTDTFHELESNERVTALLEVITAHPLHEPHSCRRRWHQEEEEGRSSSLTDAGTIPLLGRNQPAATAACSSSCASAAPRPRKP